MANADTNVGVGSRRFCSFVLCNVARKMTAGTLDGERYVPLVRSFILFEFDCNVLFFACSFTGVCKLQIVVYLVPKCNFLGQIEHPVYRTYIGLGALTVLIVLAVVMFWAIFLSPEENPSIDPEVSRKVYERMGERDQAPPPPKKTVCCPVIRN